VVEKRIKSVAGAGKKRRRQSALSGWGGKGFGPAGGAIDQTTLETCGPRVGANSLGIKKAASQN